MKSLSWIIGITSFAFAIHTYCFSNQQIKENEPVYLENIYFGLYNGTSQGKIKNLAEYILENHGIHADINVSL